MTRTVFILTMAAVLCCRPAHAQGAIDDLLVKEMALRHIPGAVVTVVRDGEILHNESYGLADVERAARMAVDTVVPIGSVTKQFTAAATLMLVHEGKIELDRPVFSYLPQLPPAYRDVTIRHLLAHVSGISRDVRSDDRTTGRPSLIGAALYEALANTPPRLHTW